MTEYEPAIREHITEFPTGLKTFHAVDYQRYRRPRNVCYVEDGEIDDLPFINALFLTMKNEGWTWDMIAMAISTDAIEVTGALVRKVALGLCNSPKIEAALGLREELVTVPLSQVKRTWKRSQKPARKRRRLTIETNDATIKQFDTQRGEQSRREYLNDLLDMANGVKEMEI